MKQITKLLLISTIVITLFAGIAYAADPFTPEKALNDISNFFKIALSVFFGNDASTNGKILSTLFFIMLAVGVYELLAAFGVKQLTSAVVGAGMGLAVTLIIPSSTLLAVFSLYGAVVLTLAAAFLLAGPTWLTYKFWHSESTIIRSSLIGMWAVINILFITLMNGEFGLTNGLIYIYMFGALVVTAVHLLMGETKARFNIPGRIRDLMTKKLEDVVSSSKTTILLMESHIKRFQTEAGKQATANFTTVTADLMRDLDLVNLLLQVEARQSADAALTADINRLLNHIEHTSFNVAAPAPYGHMTIEQYCNFFTSTGNWTGLGSDTERTQVANGFVQALQALDIQIKLINQRLKK